MRALHFDCFSGISGDMVLGSLLDVGVPADQIRAALDSLGLPVQIEIETVKRCGFRATKANIIAKDEEDYRFLPDIIAILDKADIHPKARALALKIFEHVARAESIAHGMPLERVHFHEVGALDSIADIVGAAVGLTWLNAQQITASAVAVGSGTVKCAHGIMPIPTPGTAELLKGVPIMPCAVKGELATPTGVAILISVVNEFVPSPSLTIETIGHGAGTKDPLEQPNMLRLLVGTTVDNTQSDTVTVLETNLDDCPGELIGYTMERLFAAGALDVYTVPITMKKHRPGVILSVICERHRVSEFEQILFAETGTFGVRRHECPRTKLSRESIEVNTTWGIVRAKRGTGPGGVKLVTPEYESCAALARTHGVPLRQIYDAVRKAAD